MFIGEVARRAGLSKDGIRYYERLGLLHSYPVTAGSKTYRDYDDTTLERLSIIALAKRLHFRLGELPETLDKLMSDTISREDRSKVLRDKVVEVDNRIKELILARNLLADIADNPEKPFVDSELKRTGLWLD
ncbi:MAG: MerR family copper efflux transcriptional regulator [Paracoccaceae bacterium]|jgi:MerR family copper efflux transcriptional regulator